MWIAKQTSPSTLGVLLYSMNQIDKSALWIAAIVLGAVVGSPILAQAQMCMVTTPIGPGEDLGTSVAMQPDGRIVLAGYASNGANDDVALVRYNQNFTLDTSFGAGGIVTTPIGAAQDRGEAMVIQPDGKIVVAGHKNSGAGNNDFAVVRYNADGGLDTSFNPGGVFGGPPNLAGMVVTAISGSDDEIEAVALQTDGKIVVAGFRTTPGLDYVVARYNTDGSLDTAGFNAPIGFLVSTNGAANDVARAMGIQSDGKIVVGGWVRVATDDFSLVRLNTDGTQDLVFGNITIDFPSNGRDRGNTLVIQPDDKIVLAGEVRNGFDDFGAARRNADGTADLGFGTGSLVTTSFTGNHDAAYGMVLQSDLKLVLGGWANWTGAGSIVDFALLRYNANGTPDNSFDVDSKVTTDVAGDNDWIDSLWFQPDGKILAGGYSDTGPDNDFALVRYNTDGSVDTSCVSTQFRSIGTAAARTSPGDGTVTATKGSKVVTGAGSQWRTWSRGRGDAITIAGVDYTVANVVSETELRLTTGYAGATGGGLSYTIDRQFDTLTDWEDCIDGPAGTPCTYFPVSSNNLVVDNRNEIGIAYRDSTFTDSLVLNGAVTDPTHSITLTADAGNRHAGVPGTGVVLDPASTAVGAHGIMIQVPHTRVEWLEITGWGSGASVEGVRIDTDNAILDHLLIHGGPQTTDVASDGIYVPPNGNYSGTIRNTIIYNIPRAGILLDNALNTFTLDFDVENVTVYNCGIAGADPLRGGITAREEPGTTTIVDATNVLSVGNTNNDFTVGGAGSPSWGVSDFNISTDASAPPSASRWTGVAASGEFVSITAGSEDLHLKAGAVAFDQGLDLSPAFTTDIDRESRPQGAQWDIGADELVSGLACASATAPWFDTGWQYRKAISINSTMVAAPLTDYPALVRRATDTELAAYAQNSGDDLLFTAGDGVTQLSHEIERFNGGSGELVAWVKVPYVSSGADTVIYIYYGNGGAANQEDATNVWNTNFRAVWHLSEDPSVSQLADSTAGANHGTAFGGMTGANQVPGQIAGSLDFDGIDDLVHAGVGLDNLGPMTASAWVRPDVVSGTAGKVVAKYDSSSPPGRWYLELDDSAPEDNAWEFAKGYVTADLQRASSNATATFNQWQYVAITWDGSASGGNVHLYKNGSELGYQVTNNGVGAKEPDTGSPLLIGNRSDTAQGFDGLIDEVRISDLERPQEWLEAEFRNQDDPFNFCQFCAQTTEVKLVSFEAVGGDGAVELRWTTASELNNLGFHVYRASSAAGSYTRITERLIHGLGSSPAGAEYTYRDTDVANGTTYFYQLEDVETSGRTERHGPVSATPQVGLIDDGESTSREAHDTAARLIYGNPDDSVFNVELRKNGAVLTLDTRGFHAVQQEDGTVRLEVPGFQELVGAALPVKRAWVEALAGRNVEIVSVRARGVERFSGLRPSGVLVPQIEASSNGTVRASVARRGRRLARREGAKLIDVAYQGETKKALFELSPFTSDGDGLVFARRLEVHVVFRGREASQRRSRVGPGRAAARLAVVERGLYSVPLQDLVGRRRARRASMLRVSRQGEDVAHHLENGVLYFWSEGAAANPYGAEAIYELELGVTGKPMMVDAPSANDEFYWHSVEREENRYYQAGLVDSPDPWLWEALFAPDRKAFSFEVNALAGVGDTATLELWLQGTSDFAGVDDHHVRVYVNGTLLTESYWDGKNARRVETGIGAGVLVEGENVLELESVGDTGAAYSMIMLDRFRVVYPRQVSVLESSRFVVDITDTPRWVSSRTGFAAERHYVAIDDARVPETRRTSSTKLRKSRRADYLVIGPKDLLDAAKPLLRHRKRQGLRVATASTEDVASEFGHGELTPESIRELIAHAYHEWRGPKIRYVLLLGDATYDFKDYMGTGVVNQLPPYIVKTSYLLTASDPAYAAVNGDDLLPDVAIGRLPAKSTEELTAMVEKILAYERGELTLDAPFVLVADDADRAGDFESDAEEIASTLFAGHDTQRIYLSELGASAARDAIIDSFDAGASTVSYLGHGGIHLWADENVFNASRVELLTPQAQQPLLLTMNCLNGYFHFPFFDSLAEALLKQRDKGVVAAFSPSGLSLNTPAHRYHKALLRALLEGGHERLGDAVLAAQQEYAETGAFPELLSIYHLFGDPAFKLRQPSIR